jgi:hypothetical protein
MKTNWLPIVIFCFPAWLLFGVPAYSQDAPSFEQGMNPGAVYHSGDFDHVNMANGRLNLHIPLVTDRSQRGNLNFTYSLSYSSPSWVIAVNSLGQGYWKPSGGYSPAGINFGIDEELMGLTERTVKDSGTSYHMYLALEGSGNVHPLGRLSSGGLGAIDGSGITGLTNKQGTQFTILSAEDTNSNEMSWSPSNYPYSAHTMTDTLGRSWITSSLSSNVTGCPAVPVSPTSSFTWTIPGPSGGTRIFKFCYSPITIQT